MASDPIRILIVDDVATNREFIREALMCREYKITEAVAGGQALEMMENEGADLVITDLRMPGISGVDLLKKLRVKYPDTTVILVTAWGTVESAVEAMKAGRQMVTQGVETTNHAGEALKRIIQMADQVDSMIAQIAAASMQQAAAAQQSSESVDAINQLGEESAASIPAANSIVESVEHGSRRLQQHIGKFRLEGTHTVAPRTTPTTFGPKAAAAYGD